MAPASPRLRPALAPDPASGPLQARVRKELPYSLPKWQTIHREDATGRKARLPPLDAACLPAIVGGGQMMTRRAAGVLLAGVLGGALTLGLGSAASAAVKPHGLFTD